MNRRTFLAGLVGGVSAVALMGFLAVQSNALAELMLADIKASINRALNQRVAERRGSAA